jgi:hypothetical protein
MKRMSPAAAGILILAALALAGTKGEEAAGPKPEAGGDCFAYIADGRCLATKAEFDQRVRGLMPDSQPKSAEVRAAWERDARASVLANLTESDFFSDESRNPEVGRDIENEGRRDALRNQSRFAASLPDTLLRRLSEEFAEARFRNDRDARLEAFVATDSLLIDSLRLDLERTGRGTGRIPASFRLDRIPDEIFARVRNLVPGIWQPPFRSRFGFILLRLNKRDTRSGREYQESTPILAMLARAPALTDSLAEARVRAYYDSNPAKFRRPDTVRVDLALQPRTLRKTVLRTVPALHVELADLPVELGAPAAQPLARGALDTPATLETEWGLAIFRVTDRRPGKGIVALAEAHKALRAKLDREWRDSVWIAARSYSESKSSGQAAAFSRQALEDAYAPKRDILDSLANAADASVLAAFGDAGHIEENRQAYRDILRVQMAQHAVDSVHAEWIRKNVRLAGQ